MGRVVPVSGGGGGEYMGSTCGSGCVSTVDEVWEGGV